MLEKNIKIIINGMTTQHGYLLEDIKSKNNNSKLWTVSKNISGFDYRIIFTTPRSLNQLTQYDIPADKNNIYILLSDGELSSDESGKILETNNLLEKPLIKVNVSEKKVNYSQNVKLEVVNDLVSVMNNNNLRSRPEKVNLQDKPWITIIIIAINVIMYGITAYLSYMTNGSILNSDTNVLVLLGAKVNDLINQGQYYRLVTCMFLHGGIVHVAVNMYSLYAIGPMVESVYGKAKYLVIYFISGICASIFSYIFSTSVSIGASGAIFGLLGAVLVFAITSKEKTGSAFIKNILSVIFINIFIGATMPGIDNFAHVGGLIGGMLVAFLMNFGTKE
ncbi:rhomboid family intramembrane serine protease [Clostridium estertheticum]|uniref:rhomboid family intramembrane serine protease n=1 Tax=Clostridium estertheticum TaxID=238834 RepID=UPI001C0B431E|nr:rhomboid family intramembrane serine protease [Clostridium estertheticum]MBU3216896.1 rhomboid family intramembrane serine protease [Clostridium estertheticum]WAG53917.1 rhomboid family intramembrane serine protease [Clostridium estertheticum]